MATGERFGSIFDGGTMLGLGPAELLHRFAERRDEAAFTALVAHHGPMVLATCRRILPNGADADDAFQATFLVLAKKAASIHDPDRLAPWLHGVARRVSVRARTVATRRREVEGDGVAAIAPAPDDAHDLRAVLDEELARLPEKYRAPLVLCYLEGLTHDEAAAQLRWPVGTVRSRLAGGRDRLRSSLARRGFAPGALAVLSPPALPTLAVSPSLQAMTVRLVFTTASQSAATSAALLAQGALTSMFYSKIQTAAVATIAAATTLATGAAGVVAAQSYVLTPTEAKPVPPDEAKPAPKPLADQPPSTPANPAAELDAAKARIKALEAELLALRTPGRYITDPAAPAPPQPPARPPGPGLAMAGAPPVPPVPPVPSMMGGRPLINAAASGPWTLPFVGNRILISPAERNRATMIDTGSGKKITFSDPENLTKIIPSEADNLLGLYLEGPRVSEVVAFSILDNAWSTQPLREPLANGKVTPIIGDRMVRYCVGKSFYVFSPQANRWAVLDLKQTLSDGKLPPTISTETGMVVPEGDILHAYSIRTGEWTHINTKDDK